MITASAFVTPIYCFDNADVGGIVIWESASIDVFVVVVVVDDVLICGAILVIVSDFLESAFGCAINGDNNFCIVNCVFVLFAGTVIVDDVGDNRIEVVGLCFVDVLIVFCMLLHMCFVSISLYVISPCDRVFMLKTVALAFAIGHAAFVTA